MPEPFIKQLLRGKFALTVYHPRSHDSAVADWIRDNLVPKRAQIVGSSPVIQDNIKYSVLAFVSELDARKFRNWALEQKFDVKKFEESDFDGWV